MFDVVIVGAGPAGSTLARLLPGGARVLLADRRYLDDEPREGIAEKLCGGLIAPAAQLELARQGLGVPHDVVVGPQLFAVRTVDLSSGLERLYQRHYLNVDRSALDRWFASLVPARVERAFGWSLAAIEPSPRGHLVRFSTPGGGRATVEARLVVGADGAASAVRRIAFPNAPAPRRYVAVQAEFDATVAEAHYGALFDERLTDFYGWTIPKAGRLLAGAAFPAGPGVPQRFERFTAACRRSGLVTGAELTRASCAVLRPSRVADIKLAGAGVALLGEAAGLISPSSAEGLSYALRSAAMLAGRVSDEGYENAADAYARQAATLGLEVLGKGAKAAVIGAPSVRRLIMRAGLGALPVEPSGTVVEAFGL